MRTSDQPPAPDLVIRHLTEMPEIVESSRLIATIWGDASGMPTNLSRAIQHAGGYVVGAYRAGRMVGTTVAFRGHVDGADVLHSHITGVTEEGQGIGTALKHHQRRWAAAQGLAAVTWTFDPLVARNGWFNLAKLGATAHRYLVDHYGVMDDPVNAGDATDRLAVWWPVEAQPRAAVPGGEVRLLAVDELDRPALMGIDVDGSARVYAVGVPDDIAGLRSVTPNRAKEWRQAVRVTMGEAMALGYVVRAMRRDGTYLLTRPEEVG
ncbi:GNAT family N-acetyltransferase [Euzebya sp.]|uniref:GNAT family N-acetyltransferase n=1 Tax=Euzebya sp. TaxID=1971409 RepID=UPI003515FF91